MVTHRPARTRRHRTHAAIALVALTALTTACAHPSGDPVDTDTPVDSVAALAARPPIADALARYEQMQKRIRDAIDAELGPRPWRALRPGSQRTCNPPFDQTNGVVLGMRRWGFSGSIPDDKWPQIQQAVAAIAAEYGFNAPGMQSNRPGNHVTTGVDTTLGAYYDFGDSGNTVMQVVTGCHRPN